MNWREFVKRGQWNKIPVREMQNDELVECYREVIKVLPVVTRGDGVETYEDYIAPSEAKTLETYHAALLLKDIRSQAYIRKPPSQISDFMRDAVMSAKQVLNEHGIQYHGMRETFLYWAKDGEIKQLKKDVGAALLQRREDWYSELFDDIDYEDRETIKNAIIENNRRLDLYPWRRVCTLHTALRRDLLPENSKLHHAVILLDSYRTFQVEFEDTVQPHYWWGEGQIGNKGHRAANSMSLARSAYIIGREHEAILKKTFEPAAVTGKKVKSGQSKAAQQRKGQTEQATRAILTEMRSLIESGNGISQAARIAFKRGFGSSQDANRAAWYRRVDGKL